MFKVNKSFFWINQLKKDFLVDFSYKISFFGQFFGMFLTAISFFSLFLKFFVDSESSHLEEFNYNYFIFVTVGVAIFDIVITLMRALTTSLREAQSFGYVEIFFISRVNAIYIFLCSTIYPFIKSIIKFSIYIFFLQILGDHDFLLVSIFKSFIILLIMIVLSWHCHF